jgi:hypothetical protein
VASSVQTIEGPMQKESAPVPDSPTGEETRAQVEKVLASPPFQHSDSNRRLLAFLAQQAEIHPGQPVKEFELAASVFNLSLQHFDPQVDSVVRVKVGRLRAKILDYYANFGVQDEIVLEVPKGAYCLLSRYRQTQPPVPAEETSPSHKTQPRSAIRPQWLILAVALICGFILGGSAILLWFRAQETKTPAALRHFWTEFYSNRDKPVLAVFSNPRLAGVLSRGGLHYYSDGAGSADPSEVLNLGYAGSGDVRAIYALTRLFDQLRWDLGLESGALLSWDAAKDINLIFVGRPEQNPALHEVPLLREFYFKYNAGIINAHPQAGEQDSYSYSLAADYDYAVIAFIPGIHPQENTLVLAGDTTFGSQAAAECVTQNQCMTSILDRLKITPGQKIPYFEALLKVRLNNQVPVWSTIVAVRHYPTDYSSWVAPTPDER